MLWFSDVVLTSCQAPSPSAKPSSNTVSTSEPALQPLLPAPSHGAPDKPTEEALSPASLSTQRDGECGHLEQQRRPPRSVKKLE